MFTVTKRMEISASHSLKLPYDSPCKRTHGHNWIITVEVSAEELDEGGMVIDFSTIKEVVQRLDHRDLNKTLLGINPTAENIAKWICDEVQKALDTHRDEDSNESRVSKVTVQETENNIASYVPS